MWYLGTAVLPSSAAKSAVTVAGADEERICEKTSEAELSNSALQNMELSSLSPRKIASLAEYGKKENAVAAVLQGSVSLNQ